MKREEKEAAVEEIGEQLSDFRAVFAVNLDLKLFVKAFRPRLGLALLVFSGRADPHTSRVRPG
jgi:hypothetical protein